MNQVDRASAPKRRGPGGISVPGSMPSLSESAEGWVVRWWAGEAGLAGSFVSLVTLPLSFGFRLAAGAFHRLYDGGILPLQRAPVPVISVGNLTVGGTGKTPFSAWLIRGLRERGEKPALVARGYGADELTLHRRWNPDCPVIAEADRAYGAWKAAKKGASVVVLDDGFQHRRLARDLDIVLLADSTPRRARRLPRGPFREGFAALRRAGVVVITQKGPSELDQGLDFRIEPFLREEPVRVSFVPDSWSDLEGRPSHPPQGEYLAVCGIGNPGALARTLQFATGRAGEVMAFPDHHEYTWGDVMDIQGRQHGRTLVTTEKDAVKLESFKDELPGLKVLHLRVEIPVGEARLWTHVEGVLRSKRPRK